jgi:hypothetical protein
VLAALRLAGLQPETLAVGGAITAVILGLAAQQTVGNLIAGTVLPNNVVLSAAVVPIYRIRATPADSADGPELADEVVAALDQVNNGRQVG